MYEESQVKRFINWDNKSKEFCAEIKRFSDTVTLDWGFVSVEVS